MKNTTTEELGWLIEPVADRARWWTGECPAQADSWTINSEAAVRFARKSDVEKVLPYLRPLPAGVIITGHSWITPGEDHP